MWPAALCAGVIVRADAMFYASGTNELHLMTDVVSGVFSVICTALVPALRLASEDALPAQVRSRGAGEGWQEHRHGDDATAPSGNTSTRPRETALRVAAVGDPDRSAARCGACQSSRAFLNNLFSGVKFSTTLLGSTFGGTLSLPVWDMPALHNLVQRMPPVAPVERETRSRALRDQLAVRGRYRRVRGGAAFRARPQAERRAVEGTPSCRRCSG